MAVFFTDNFVRNACHLFHLKDKRIAEV